MGRCGKEYGELPFLYMLLFAKSMRAGELSKGQYRVKIGPETKPRKNTISERNGGKRRNPQRRKTRNRAQEVCRALDGSQENISRSRER